MPILLEIFAYRGCERGQLEVSGRPASWKNANRVNFDPGNMWISISSLCLHYLRSAGQSPILRDREQVVGSYGFLSRQGLAAEGPYDYLVLRYRP